MKTRKFTAMLLTLAMAFSLLTVSAGAVMDNDHDRISVDTAGPLSVVWDSETVDSEAYHTGDIVSSEDGYYPSSFYLYVDSAEENGITVTGGTLSAPVEETEGGTKYLVTNNSGGSIVIRLANAAQSNNVYTLTFAAPEGQMAGGAITGVLQGYLPLGQYARGTMWGSPYTDGSTTAGSTPKVLGGFSSTGVSLGAGGGYVQYALRDSEGNQAYIEDDASNPYGVDFIVYGNAFNGNPEAASVQVSEDGKTWYELAGSLYYDPNTLRDVNITYTLSGSDIQYSITDPNGRNPGVSFPLTGTFKAGAAAWFPTTANYGGVWKTSAVSSDQTVGASAFNGASVTYTGVTLVKDTDTTADYQFGYADIHVNGGNYGTAINPYTAAATTQGGDGFDIAWAVKPDGTPAGLIRIGYIRVYTSALMSSTDNTTIPTPGIFGETSAEVCGIYAVTGSGSASITEDLFIADAATGENEVNTSNGGSQVVAAGKYRLYSDMERVLLNGETISDAADGHVFTMAAGDMLQIITQTGEEAPYITVLICRRDHDRIGPRCFGANWNYNN